MSDAERWRPIEGFEGYYEVSSFGRVRSLDRIDAAGAQRRGRVLKPDILPKGYGLVSLLVGGVRSQRYVHRLVAAAFLEPDESRPHVNHKNGVRTDNRVENLEWVTPGENNIHSIEVLGRGDGRPVVGIHKRTGERLSFTSSAQAARAGFTRVAHCLAGGRKSHRGYRWSYADTAVREPGTV